MSKTYYIDWMNGNNNNDGLSESTPKQFHDDIELLPGDTVLFKRGNMLRNWLKGTDGSEEGLITFGSYGEGAKPIICGSFDVSSPDNWVEVEPNLWQYNGEITDEPCNLIFNNGESCGKLTWVKEETVSQGNWYDDDLSNSKFRYHKYVDEHWTINPPPEGYKRPLFLYSVKNPGEYYNHIEYVPYGRFQLTYAVFAKYENLTFINSGVHAITGQHDLYVENCDFHFIGGAVFGGKGMRLRFGNGVESFQHPKNVEVKNCLFNNIYDSCITHQGFWGCTPAYNVHYTNNLFMNYGMAAYEVRDHIPYNSSFTDNICIGAGKGFASLTDIFPRYSEIYPFPMGHHVFIWRMTKQTEEENAKLELKNNIFYDAPVGAAIFSFILEEPEKQFDFDYNTYYTTNPKMINRYGDKRYTPEQFSDYVEKSGQDKHSKYEKIDIRAAVRNWFEKTGRGAVSEKELDFYGL